MSSSKRDRDRDSSLEKNGVTKKSYKKGEKKVRFTEPEIKEYIPSDEEAEREYSIFKMEDISKYEEKYEIKDEDFGIQLEPFNLKEERERGTFETSGFYIENKKQNNKINDAWMSSKEAEVCSDKIREKHEAYQKTLEEIESAPKITENEKREMMMELVKMMESRETVLDALRRLGKKKKNKIEKENKEKFDKLTEIANMLLNCGETDAYTLYREEFEDMCGMNIILNIEGNQNEVKCDVGEHLNNKYKDDDIFAESDEESNKNEIAELKPSTSTSTSMSLKENLEEEYLKWPISELKRFLKEHGEDINGIIEKRELAQKVKEIASRGPEGSLPEEVPDGYVYDPTSGYFYSSEKQSYYEPNTKYYYSMSNQKWYDENWHEIV